jgi:predicted ATPase
MSIDRFKITDFAIGFQNFRRFKEFPLLEFGPITYMVGKNNAGKSTLVKAILLVSNYMKNQLGDTLSFANEVLNDVNIVTFERAKHNRTKEPFIIFKFRLNQYQCEIKISGKNDSTYGDLNSFILSDDLEKLNFSINYDEKSMELLKSNPQAQRPDYSEQILAIQKEIKLLEDQLDNGLDKRSKEGLITIDRIQRLFIALEKYNDQAAAIDHLDDVSYALNYPLRDLDELEVQTEKNPLMENASDLVYQNNIAYKKMTDPESVYTFDNEQEEEGFRIQLDAIRTLEAEKFKIMHSVEHFINLFANTDFHYLGANPTKQSALFLLRDKGNALAQAIHEFYMQRIQEGDVEHRFVLEWMKKFEVGETFELNFRGGEAYQFFIWNDGIRSHLSDKGMGTLQAMMLILKIAGLIRSNKKQTKTQIVLVEEPELNLHPASQSLLTEFFHDVYTKFNIRFIIETHSEYMIRKSQSFVKDQNYGGKESMNPNPFKTYYFPLDSTPYEMRYREDGKFLDEFQSGFFDVNSQLVINLL